MAIVTTASSSVENGTAMSASSGVRSVIYSVFSVGYSPFAVCSCGVGGPVLYAVTKVHLSALIVFVTSSSMMVTLSSVERHTMNGRTDLDVR